MELKWHTEPPEDSGYYLATWKWRGDGGSLRVSEFWFDGKNWFSGRAYVSEAEYYDLQCMTDLVVAWMPKPKPY